MSTFRAEPGTTLAWQHLPASPVAPGGGRAGETAGPRAGLTSHELAGWAALVALHTGLHFPAERVHVLRNGLARRKDALGLRSLASYRMLLDAVPAEWHELAADLTVGETRFFRQPEVFTALSEEILPEIIARKTRERDRTVRAWSAGCSTGEEAYSLGISLAEALRSPWLWEIEVRGTDLSRAAVVHAQAGCYEASRLESVPAERLADWFSPAEGGNWRAVGKKLREATTFQVHNLAGTVWPLPRYDLIVCQNVLMYLLPQLRMPVVSRLYQSLQPGGHLIIGPSELPAEALPGGVRPVNIAGILAYRRS